MVPLPAIPLQDTLAERLLPVISAWCTRLGGRCVDAEDATHEALLIVLRKAPTRDPGVPIEAFAFAITRRVLANHRRRAWWRRWVPGAAPDAPSFDTPELSLQRRELARRVDALLERLPYEQREVLVLCDVEERTSAEVAALLGVPDPTVRSRLRLARARFRDLAPAFDLQPPRAGGEP